MFFLFESTWARLTLLLTVFSAVLAYIRNFKMEQILIQVALLLLLGRDTYCITSGKCNVKSWSVILFPLAFILFYGLEALGFVKAKLSPNTLEAFRRFNQLDVDNIDEEFPQLVDKQTYLQHGNPVDKRYTI